MTNWTNVSNYQGVLESANNNSGGWFWTAVVWLVFLVLTISFSAFGIEIALLAGCFITLVISLFLVYVGLVSFQTFLIFVGILILEFIYIMWSSSRD